MEVGVAKREEETHSSVCISNCPEPLWLRCSSNQLSGAGSARAFFNTRATEACCGAAVTSLAGHAASLVNLTMHIGDETTTITLSGPAGVWYGVGFFAQAMEDKPCASREGP